MKFTLKSGLFLAGFGLTTLIFLPLVIGWSIQYAILMGSTMIMLYTHRKHPGKKVDDYYRDLWTFLSNFPYLHPWDFYTSLLGSPLEWTNYTNVPASEIAYLRRAIVFHWRVAIVLRYVSLWILSTFIPLWGTVLWIFNRHPHRTVVHPPSKVTELGISTVIKLDPTSNKDKGSERWLFVNGIGLDYEVAKLNALHLSSLFNKNVELVYKPSNGILYDILKILGCRTFDIPEYTELALSVALHEALLDNHVNKVVLIAHSQGTLVASSTVRKMIEDGTTQLRKAIESKLEVYNFANCADVYAVMPHGPHYENFVNGGDFLSFNCSKSEPKVERISSGSAPLSVVKDVTYPKTFFNKSTTKLGHLLGAHYLPDFVGGLYVGPYEETTTSKLFTYLHKP